MGFDIGRYYISKYANFAYRVGTVIASLAQPMRRPSTDAAISHQWVVSKQHGRHPEITVTRPKSVERGLGIGRRTKYVRFSVAADVRGITEIDPADLADQFKAVLEQSVEN